MQQSCQQWAAGAVPGGECPSICGPASQTAASTPHTACFSAAIHCPNFGRWVHCSLAPAGRGALLQGQRASHHLHHRAAGRHCHIPHVRRSPSSCCAPTLLLTCFRPMRCLSACLPAARLTACPLRPRLLTSDMSLPNSRWVCPLPGVQVCLHPGSECRHCG